MTYTDKPDVFRLLSLRGMLRLEKVGMKTRGGALRPKICNEFGLKKNAPHDEFIAAINRIIQEHGGNPD